MRYGTGGQQTGLWESWKKFGLNAIGRLEFFPGFIREMLRKIRNYFLAALLLSIPAISSGQQAPGVPPLHMGLASESDVPGAASAAALPLPHIALPVMAPELALQMFESRGPWQKAELKAYTNQTLVMAELPDSSQRGAFELQGSYLAPHGLTFKPIRYTGDSFVKTNIINRVLQSEVDYVSKDDVSHTALTPANYKFAYKGDEELNGRAVHMYQVKPHHKRPGLFKGRIYIDSTMGTLVRSEGTIVKSPSFFLRHIEFVQDYTDVAGYTLPAQLHTTARASFVGRVVVDIFHRQYEPQPLTASLQASDTVAGQP